MKRRVIFSADHTLDSQSRVSCPGHKFWNAFSDQGDCFPYLERVETTDYGYFVVHKSSLHGYRLENCTTTGLGLRGDSRYTQSTRFLVRIRVYIYKRVFEVSLSSISAGRRKGTPAELRRLTRTLFRRSFDHPVFAGGKMIDLYSFFFAICILIRWKQKSGSISLKGDLF